MELRDTARAAGVSDGVLPAGTLDPATGSHREVPAAVVAKLPEAFSNVTATREVNIRWMLPARRQIAGPLLSLALRRIYLECK